MSLVEVMMATGILAFVATTMVGVFLQNQRFSYFLGYRSQAITTSLSILEQLRFRQYSEIADIYNDGASGSVTVTLNGTVSPKAKISPAAGLLIFTVGAVLPTLPPNTGPVPNSEAALCLPYQ